MKKIIPLVIALNCTVISLAQNTAGYQELANYPFATNLIDATGNNANADVWNMPFTMGGIYSNGVYSGSSTPNSSNLITPSISGIEMSDLILRLDFNSDINEQKICVFGYSWRWLTVYTESDGTLAIRIAKTDGFDAIINSSFVITPGTWYSFGLTYKSTTNEVTVYADNAMVATWTLSAAINHQNDFTFSTAHAGIGETFKGYWKDLIFYKAGLTEIDPEPSFGFDSHYNAAKKTIVIEQKQGVSYSVISTTGQLMNSGITQDENSHIDASGFPTGIYYLILNDATTNSAHRLFIF